MDVSKYLELKIAPRAVFDALSERKDRPRFFVRGEGAAWTPVTWQAFADMTRDVALFLAGAGLREEDRVAIYAPNRVEWAAAALAIQAAGGVMVPVYPASTTEQVAYVVGHADAKVLFVDTPALLSRVLESWSALPELERVVLLDDRVDAKRVAAKLREAGKPTPADAVLDEHVVAFSRARAIGAARHAADPSELERRMASVSLDRTALMLYTSGTTGHPKGVPLSHRNIAVNGRDWLECNAPLLDEGAVDVLWLPMSHIFGFGEMCLGNTLGWVSYMSDPREVLSLLPELRPHVFMSVPSHWEKLAQGALGVTDPARRKAAIAAASGGRLRFCLSGGAGLKREVKEAFYDAGVLIIEGYGLTETSPTLTLNRPDAYRFDSVGKPLPSVELKLAEDGEILAKGPNVFRGYHKDDAATREIFTDDGWLKTGDVGRFTEDGFLQIVDRKKDILVTAGGKNVPPANIEVRFSGDPLIAHAVVYGDGKKFLVAGLWPDQQLAAAMSEEELRAALQRRVDAVNAELASYESIKRFAILRTPLTVEAGLLTASLKVRRKKIYEAFGRDFEALYASGS
ncbi:MAG TPA: AMP-dependent synthetase/ligase [Polyangiaceae bacterium]|nr:AMP-dependent synthetase/ligase [Polyangiaceae bacterium]